MVVLVDQYGQPIDKALLNKEIATPEIMGVRRTVEDREATGLTPERLAQILIDAQNGHARAYLTLAEEMEERYLHYASQLQTRRLAIEGLTPVIEADEGIPAKITDAVKDLIEGADFDNLCGELVDGIGKGYAVAEIMWEYQNRKLEPVEYKWRDPRYFQFDRKSLKILRLASDTNLDGEELPAAKFIRHMPRTKAGIPLRRGLARPAAWAFLIQSFGLKDWTAFSEVYGVPLRLGKYHSTASLEDKRTLLRGCRAIANDAAAIIPQGMEIEFVKVEGQHGGAVFGKLLDYVDQQISKLVVGQTMTADDGSSMAQAEVHNDVRKDILEADGKQLAATLNQDLIRPFIDLNFGPQAVYPKVSFPVVEPEDIEALSGSLAQLVPLGLKVDQREIREKMGLSDPGNDAELLTPPNSAAQVAEGDPTEQEEPEPEPKDTGKLSAHIAACRCGSCVAKLSAETVLDELDLLLVKTEWDEIADPLLEPFKALLETAKDFDEATRLLAEKMPGSEPLREALSRLTAISRGIGDLED